MSFILFNLTVNSILIPYDELHGVASIERHENQASILRVTMIPPKGAQNIDYWPGKDVSLVVDGVTAFIGVVDYPEVDVIYEKITLVCTDNRREKLNTDLSGTIDTIGFYSDAIFDQPDNVIDELEQRLQTIPSVIDLKPDGTYAITDINPKTIPDFTLLNADVYRRTPSVTPVSRLRIVNQIDLVFNFRYTRKRHRERAFTFEGPSFCEIIEQLLPATRKKTFIDYANSMSWILNYSSIVFEDFPPSGWITYCNTDNFSWARDLRFAISMDFDTSERFSQTITEQFNITVKSPQSITQYGAINLGQNNGYEIEYNSRGWEDYDTYSTPIGGTADTNDYYIDEDGVTADFDNAILTAINIANTKIINSHRDDKVDFELDLRLDIDLTHTISLSTDKITAVGKVTDIEHSFYMSGKNKSTTFIEISTSTAQGTQTPDVLSVPTRPTVPVIADIFDDPVIMLVEDDLITTPAIDETSRDEQIVIQPVTYDIEIQNSSYEVNFNG